MIVWQQDLERYVPNRGAKNAPPPCTTRQECIRERWHWSWQHSCSARGRWAKHVKCWQGVLKLAVGLSWRNIAFLDVAKNMHNFGDWDFVEGSEAKPTATVLYRQVLADPQMPLLVETMVNSTTDKTLQKLASSANDKTLQTALAPRRQSFDVFQDHPACLGHFVQQDQR